MTDVHHQTLRTAIVGCGAIARSHVAAVADIEGVEVCAVADHDPSSRAAIAALAGGVPAYATLDELLAIEAPDAVHVLTPPPSHAPLGVTALEAGAHVLIEKPMALSSDEADALLKAGVAADRLVATCHNMLFKPAVAQALELVRAGHIGRVVHVVTFWGIADDSGTYSGDPGSHWSWRLPGSYFTNFLPHTISLQQAFLGSDLEVGDVVIGTAENAWRFPTDLSVTLRGAAGWGTMTVSTSVRPGMKFVEVYGSEGVIRVDMSREICVVQRPRRVPGPLAKVLFGIEHGLQLVKGTVVSAAMVAGGKWGSNPGLAPLIADFYEGIRRNQQPVVDGEAGRSMVSIMERIWENSGSALDAESTDRHIEPGLLAAEATGRESGDLAGTRVLVTGATGFLGSHLVRALRSRGADVAVLVRSRKRLTFDIEQSAAVFEGDLADRRAIDRAMAGARIVFHCAAVTTNKVGWDQHYEGTVAATANLAEAAAAAGVDRFVHVSSVAVYGFDKSHDGRAIDESTPLDTVDDPWSPYARAKVEAEHVVRRIERELGLPVAIIRPGILYGPGRPLKPGLARMGNWWLSIGSGRNALPFTFVGNAVDAMVRVASSPEAAGEAFNIVDEPQAGVVDLLSRADPETPRHIVPFPTGVAEALARLDERRVARRAGGRPLLSEAAVRGRTRDIRYDTTKAKQLLGWRGDPEAAATASTTTHHHVVEGAH